MSDLWLSVLVVVMFGLRVWANDALHNPPVPGWEWALAGFFCGGNLCLWAGRHAERRKWQRDAERAAMQPQIDYMRDRLTPRPQ